MSESIKLNPEIKEKLKNRWWRLNNLYYLKTKEGQKIKFSLNWAQEDLFFNMHNFNLILKARACAPAQDGWGHKPLIDNLVSRPSLLSIS